MPYTKKRGHSGSAAIGLGRRTQDQKQSARSREAELQCQEAELEGRERTIVIREQAFARALDTFSSTSSTSTSTEVPSSVGLRFGMSEIKKLIPPFNPSTSTIMTVEKWLTVVENCRATFGWDEQTALSTQPCGWRKQQNIGLSHSKLAPSPGSSSKRN